MSADAFLKKKLTPEKVFPLVVHCVKRKAELVIIMFICSYLTKIFNNVFFKAAKPWNAKMGYRMTYVKSRVRFIY